MNARMPALKLIREAAGSSAVVAVLSSGTVVFGTRGTSNAAIQRNAEAALQAHLSAFGRNVTTRTLETIRKSAFR